MSERIGQSEIIKEELAERGEELKRAIFENIEGLAYEMEIDRSGQFRVSIVHLMERIGDDRTFAEIGEDEKLYYRELFRSNEVATLLSNHGMIVSDIIDVRDNEHTWIDIEIQFGPVDQTSEAVEASPEVEKKHITYRNTCYYCKSEVSLEADALVSEAGKVKKDKLKRRYRDWDKEIDCPHCQTKGEKHPVIITFREYLDVINQ